MKNSKLVQSASDKRQYAGYRNENRWYKNKVRKLTKHLKQHPNDKQTENSFIHLKP